MMNSLLQYYVLRRHDDTFDFHFYNANEYANECEQLFFTMYGGCDELWGKITYCELKHIPVSTVESPWSP